MKGDFMGFSFDGIHCSKLGITRVSGGDRYEEELFPSIEDKTNEIVGGDGSNYFGSIFKEKSFSISIAFDSITETQFRRIRRLFGTKKICELIFDERPYKVYSVKLANPIKLEYICFNEHKRHPGETIEGGGIRYVDKDGQKVREDITPWVYEYDDDGAPVTERIYKGEGEIEFVTYSPFAKQLYKILDLYTNNNIITKYDNVDEWSESSGLLTADIYNDYDIDKTCIITEIGNYNLKIPVYNPGDLNTGFYLYIPFTKKVVNNENEEGYEYVIEPNTGDYIEIYGDQNGLLLNPIKRKNDNDTGIIINTVNHLIEGVIYDSITEQNNYRNKSWQVTGSIYNDSIIKGDFPQIIRSDWYFDNEQFKQAIYLNCAVEEDKENLIQVNYDYLYF